MGLLYLTILLSSCVNDVEFESKTEDIPTLLPKDDIINVDCQYIGVIGDIQEYTNSFNTSIDLNHSFNWFRSQQIYYENFKCILQVGDLTNNNLLEQWKIFDNSLRHLDREILFITTTGNHDYDWDSNYKINNRKTGLNSLKNLILPDSAFNFYECGLENSFHELRIHNKSVCIISIEFGARPEVVIWAKEIIESHPNDLIILMTHEFLDSDGNLITYGSYADNQLSNIPHTNPLNQWETLVSPYNNVIVLCGHNGFCQYSTKKNNNNKFINLVLFNLQFQQNGGDGLIQLWEFPNDMKQIKIFVYNTKRKLVLGSYTNILINDK